MLICPWQKSNTQAGKVWAAIKKTSSKKNKKRKTPVGTSYWRQNLIELQPNVLCAPLDCALGRAFSELTHKLRLSKHECQIQASPLACHKKGEIKPRRKYYLFFFYHGDLTLVSCQTPTLRLLPPSSTGQEAKKKRLKNLQVEKKTGISPTN